jgi:hypothetical protein
MYCDIQNSAILELFHGSFFFGGGVIESVSFVVSEPKLLQTLQNKINCIHLEI